MAALSAKMKQDARFTIGGEIGRGACCVVYEGRLNGKPVAIKKIHSLLLQCRDAERTEVSHSMHQSALLLKQLSHPHIVKFIEFYESKYGDHALVMERLDCNLESYLERHAGKLSRERQIDFCLQTADAVHYLHSQQPPVAYRSLSGRNVLLAGDGILKLCLCLQAARLPSCGYFDNSQPGMLVYMPPEALTRDARYNEKIDIFSLGVVMLQIATQCSPTVSLVGVGTVREITRRKDDLSRLPEDHPLKPIILQCLRDEPGERPNSGAVFRMLSEVAKPKQTPCSCQCQQVKDQVTEINHQLGGHKRQLGQVAKELSTVKGHIVNYEDGLQAKDKQIEELQQMIANLREGLVQRDNEFTASLSAIEAQVRALQPPWAIPEADLEVTNTVLGRGAYGEVRVGVYHGDRVAVKRLHNVIASDYYHRMIQREMGIAARLRHPKLVLFIGAVTRGNLTIVTELMETSLRSELEHGRLQVVHILPISRDVASALCYLHSLPEPIIHRDVSSANVLLNSTKAGWVAKVGDYGSANFQAKLQTVGPGCPVYAAPEAGRPEEQGPKMDVYSYGVLLLEMCTGTLPDPRDLPVIQQGVRSWGQPKRQLGELASQCIIRSSDRRPHMRSVVTQLDGM